MILLHGCVESGHLLVWGEARSESSPRPRRTVKTRPAVLSFGANPGHLAAVLSEVLPVAAEQKEAAERTIWLPTVDGQAVASSPLIADPPEAILPPELAPWRVSALPLSPGRVIDLLCACRGKDALAPGAIVGKTLAYWAGTLPLASSLVAREQFLPHVEQLEKGWRACWRPVPSGADLRQLTQLAQAMPSACRAINGQGSPSARPSASVLTEFIGTLVDELVRSSVSSAEAPAAPGRKRKPVLTFDSLHDQWLHALRSADGALTGADAELAALAEQVSNWQRPVTVSAAAPFRLCFRLEEPKANGTGRNGAHPEHWLVRYLLQAQDDPSLLVPAEKAWKPTGQTGTLLKRNSFEPREYLLSALGQAAGLCPPVETSLKSPAPAEFHTDTTEAFRFLTESSLLLEQAGFGVILPAWWTRTGTKQRLSVTAQVKSPKSQSSGQGLRLDEIVRFEWQVALGDQPLTLEEIQALARLKQPLVQVRGQWVQVNADEIQAALDFWNTTGDAEATVRQVMQMALGRAETPGGLAFAGVQATGWVADLLDQLEGRRRSRNCRRRKVSGGRCGRTNSAATPGWPSCAAGGSAPVWPTTWAWARPSRRWR